MSVEDDVKRLDEKMKISLLQAEKRLSNIESSLQNLSSGMQRGSLTTEQEGRVATVEERLENVEDLQMVANLDLLKMREFVEKLPEGAQPNAASATGNPVLENRVSGIESAIRKLENKVSEYGAERAIGEMHPAKPVGSAPEFEDLRKDISQLRAEVSSFRSETEEVIKVIISSIKRLSEVLK